MLRGGLRYLASSKFPMAGMGCPPKLQLQKGLYPPPFRSKTALLRTH